MKRKIISNLKSTNNKLALFFGFTVIVGFAFSPLWILSVFVLPACFAIKSKSYTNWLIAAPLALFINLASLVFLASTMSLTGITLSAHSLVLSSAILVLVFAASGVKISVPEIPKNRLKYICLIYVLFVVTFAVRVVSVINANVPILHDPIAHAYFVESILSKGAIEYWYSPALHIVSATLSMFGDVSSAKSIHLVSNSLNALTVLTWGIFAYMFTKKVGVSVLASVLILVSSNPALTYTSAGKNAYVMAVAVLPFVLYAFNRFTASNKKLDGIIFAASLFLLGMSHSPSFALVFGGLGIAIISISIRDLNKNYRSVFLGLIKALWPFLLAVIIIGIWSWHSYDFLLADKANNVPKEKPTFAISDGQNLISYWLKEAINVSLKPWGEAPTELYKVIGALYLPVMLVSAIFGLFVYRPKDRNLSNYNIVGLSLLVSAFILIVLIPISGVGLNIVRLNSIIMLVPLALLAGSGSIWAIASKFKASKVCTYVLVGLVVIVVSWSLKVQLDRYRQATHATNTVNSYDLAAFDWINQNIDDTEGFIVGAQQEERRKFIFVGGSGAWIPVFTQNRISMPFQEGEFNSVETRDNFDQYKLLLDGDAKAAKYFSNKDFNYLYHDLNGWLVDQMLYKNIGQYEFLELAYENPEVRIYKIVTD